MKLPLDYDEANDAGKKRNYFFIILILTLISFILLKLMMLFVLLFLFGEGHGALMEKGFAYFPVVIIQILFLYFAYRKNIILSKEFVFLCIMSLAFFIFKVDEIVLDYFDLI